MKEIILNTVHSNTNHLVNFIVVVVKQHIFASKCLGMKPSICTVVNQIENIYQIEKYNAKIDGNNRKKAVKWRNYDTRGNKLVNNK